MKILKKTQNCLHLVQSEELESLKVSLFDEEAKKVACAPHGCLTELKKCLNIDDSETKTSGPLLPHSFATSSDGSGRTKNAVKGKTIPATTPRKSGYQAKK